MEVINFLIIPMVYFIEEAEPYFKSRKNIFQKVLFFIRLILTFIYNSLTYMLAQILGFIIWFFPQNRWNKTEHTVKYNKTERM